MCEVKRLLDPLGLLNPGVLLDEDSAGHISHLKSTPTVETEVDRCVECGYCEPVCPSQDLTISPRRRIVLRREMARAKGADDAGLLAELERDYQYDALDTCAVDGMCATACPVGIDTGDLTRRLRAEQRGRTEQRAWAYAARHWDGVTRTAATALTAARTAPAVLPTRITAAGRALLGDDTVPAWSADLRAAAADAAPCTPRHRRRCTSRPASPRCSHRPTPRQDRESGTPSWPCADEPE
ncbi:(Fe-S)-binding protein [Streptomyces mirabilis]|nr:(Fe-S)-binding protein [Streptomyces mirabilis]